MRYTFIRQFIVAVILTSGIWGPFFQCASGYAADAAPLPEDILDAEAGLKKVCTLVSPFNEAPLIVLGTEAGESERFAARELSEHLHKMTGREIRIVTDNAIPKGPKLIAIGKSRLTTGYDVSSLGVEQFIIDIKPDGMAIIGGSLAPVKDAAGKQYVRDRGTLYGVYDFLQSLGVRWYRPEPWGWHIPQMDTMELPVGKRVSDQPAFLARSAPRWDTVSRVYGSKPEDIELTKLWVVRQRLNRGTSDESRYGGSIISIPNWHSQSGVIVQPGKYLKNHPEYFALVNGKRGNPGSGRNPQLCLGNPELQNVFADNVLQLAKKNPQWDLIPIDPEDGTQLGSRMCVCPLCIAMDDPADPQKMSNRVFAFANIIARKVAGEMPQLKLALYAYSTHTDVPTKVTKLEPNIIVALANINSWTDWSRNMFDQSSPQNSTFVKLVEDWRKIAPHKLWMREYSSYGWIGPIPMYHLLQDRVRSYRKLGFEGIFWGSEVNWGPQMPLIYFKSQLQWNPDLDIEKELNLFYTNYYGPAAVPMKAYHEKWMAAFEQTRIGSGMSSGISSGGRGMHILCNPALIKELGGYINQAQEAVKGKPLYGQRLKGDVAGYEFCRRISRILTLKMERGEVVTNLRTSTKLLRSPEAEQEWESLLQWLKEANKDQLTFDIQLRDNAVFATALTYMKRDILENGRYGLWDEPALMQKYGFGRP